MAEPATQSPYISSSAGGGSLEPAGRELKGAGSPQSSAGNLKGTCEKSMLSNAQKESLDDQRQDYVCGISEDSGIGPAALKEASFSAGSKGLEKKADPLKNNDIPRSALSGKPDLFACDQPKDTAARAESKSALLTNPKSEPAQASARGSQARSSVLPAAAAETTVEKDSPESPFEVIADKLEFDKEFKEILSSNPGDGGGSNWAVHGQRELLTDIPEDSVCEFQPKPRGGSRLPSGPALTRQSSGTTAALEEVSKCVREMHSFTSELLNWDLIPKDLGDKPDAPVGSAFLPSPTKDGGQGAAGSGGGKVEAGKTCPSHQPLTISLHQKGKPALEAEGKPTVVSQKASPEKPVPAPAVDLKADVRWPNSSLPEVMDADSSGESDDTVIEDLTAIPVPQNGKAVDRGRAGVPAKPDEPMKAETVPVGGQGTTSESRKPSQGSRDFPSALECSWGSMDDFEAIQAKDGVLGENPVGPSRSSQVPIPALPAKARQELGGHGQDPFGKRPKMDDLPLSSAKETPDGESFVDFMKECMKAKGGESPEDPVETFSEAELRAARSHGVASAGAQDFEQERVTIKALKDAGRKSEAEGPHRATVAGGRRHWQPGDAGPEPPAPVQRSALEKRPLCLEQAVGMKVVSAPAASLPGKSSQAPAVPPAVRKLLAEFSVHDLIFWRDVKKTGLVFSTTLILLLSLAAFSVISVVSYLILALLSVTISFRVYKSVIQAVQKSEEGHPFKAYLDLDVALSSEAFHNYVSTVMAHVNRGLKLTMRLFLVEDLVDSLKLAVVMWLMTYIGALFNGITLLILAELLTFSLPVVYEKYKTQIDHYIGIVRDQTKMIASKIQAKLPGAVKKKAE